MSNISLNDLIYVLGKWSNNEIERRFVEEELNKENNGFVTEAGDVEKWVGKLNKQQVLESKEKTISYLKSLRKE